MDLSKIVKRKEVEKRTTFKLTRGGCDELDYLMDSFGLTHKNIFNIILSDDFPVPIHVMAKKDLSETTVYEIKKTMVITSEDLEKLNGLSQEPGVNRNQMIDGGIRVLASLLRKDKKDTFEKYQIALKSFNEIWGEMERVESELKDLLPEGDSYLREYGESIVTMMNLVNRLEKEISQEYSEESEKEEK